MVCTTTPTLWALILENSGLSVRLRTAEVRKVVCLTYVFIETGQEWITQRGTMCTTANEIQIT